ncbi:LEA type 2 family protein [Halobacteriaceae archaeon GCM10025711]
MVTRRLTTMLFGSVTRIVLVVLLGAVLLGAGAFATGALGVPSVTGVQNYMGDVNETVTVIETDVHVSNPNAVGVSPGDVAVDYEVRMNDVTMATGHKQGVDLPKGNSTVSFTSHMQNGNISDWWVSHIRNGESTTVAVDATVGGLLGQQFSAPPVTRSVETDVIGEFNSTETRPVNANQPFVSDPVLYINETSASWGEVTAEETPIRMRFTVYNPKSYAIPVSELGYNVTMNEVHMGSGATDREYVIPPHESRTIETTATLRNERLDEWWVTHVERNQTTDLRIEFDARLDMTGVGGSTVTVPLRQLTYTETIETDLFGTKNATRPTTDTDSNDPESTTTTTESESATDSTTTAETTTEEPTTTATSTTTTTTTTTEDGGLLG